MNVEMLTCIMIEDKDAGKVLVQNRIKKYPGWSFPGGHVEKCESFYDCAVREVEEETGLRVKNLEFCGVVHWVHKVTDERYLCFLYRTSDFDGELLESSDEGENFWLSLEELLKTPEEKFSSVHYALSPLFHGGKGHSEVFIKWNDGENDWRDELK